MQWCQNDVLCPESGDGEAILFSQPRKLLTFTSCPKSDVTTDGWKEAAKCVNAEWPDGRGGRGDGLVT